MDNIFQNETKTYANPCDDSTPGTTESNKSHIKVQK